jgi:tetratricopeptide (TPR) repeat protein
VSSKPQPSPAITLQRVQYLYDRNLFLQAYRETGEYWKPSTQLENLSADELILAARLATRLGGLRLSRWLFRMARERDPSNPRVRYYTSYVRSGGWRLFDKLRAFDAAPELSGADAETSASWFAYHAVLWASLRDFTRAHQCIERARSHKATDDWVLSCEADVFGYEDRWSEALKSAELAWQISLGTPYTAHSLGECLLNLGRVREATERLSVAAENAESYEVAHLACWYLCALSETVAGGERDDILGRARTLGDLLPTLAPLADRESRAMFARVGLDIAELTDDHEAMERCAKEIGSPFHRKVLDNLRNNPKRVRIRLPFRRAIQKHEACLPTSIASALAASGLEIDPDAMTAEITFGGTAGWAAAEWLEKRGLEVRFFVATPEVSASLIRNGIAFVVTLEADANAHAVAAVGLDEAAGTLIIHDPEAFRTTEYLLERMGKDLAPLGPKGMVAVPPEKANLLDQLLAGADAETMAATEGYYRASVLKGRTAASELVANLARRYPSHPTTRMLKALDALEEGRLGKALVEFQDLLRAFPNSAFVRARLLASCRSLHNTALMRETLAGVVERGIVPGVQSQQKWLYPPAAYVSEYADLLRRSAETRDKAAALLHSVIRLQPTCPDAWHILGDLLWHQRDIEGALLGYRVAAGLASSNEHYARAYCDARGNVGREQEGLRWLEDRVRKFGASERAIGTWITWISALEDWGHPERALAACEEALAQHGHSSDLLAFVVPFVARMGLWERSESLLQRLKEEGNTPLFREAAVAFHQMRGDIEKATQHAEEWVTELPLSIRARHELVGMVAKREGGRAAITRAARWLVDFPGHDDLEELYCQQLNQTAMPSWKKYSVLLRRVRRNPEDGWAWRDLAFTAIYDYEAAGDQERRRLERQITNFIRQCDRTAPEDAATLRVHAQWQEARGEWQQATESWLKSIDHDPASLYSYRHAWDSSAQLAAEKRQEVWQRMEAMLLRSPGRLSVAREIIMLAARRFGVAMAEKAASSWKKLRPDDPEVLEASVDLLLDYGQGRTDAERALEMLQPACEHFPYHVGLRFSLADALRKLGRFAEAEGVLSEILRRHPDNSSAKIQLAWVHQRHGRLDEGLRVLEAAADQDPQNTQISDAHVQMLIVAGRLEQARIAIDEYLKRFPESVYWRERAIRLLVDCGDAEGAVRAAREGTDVYPRGAYLWLQLGRTLNELRRFAAQGEIESCLRRSLALNRGLFDAADHLAILLVEQRRFGEAEETIRQVRSRLGDYFPAQGRLAWIHREQGLRREALDELAALVEAAPWYLWGWRVLMGWLVEDQAWEKARNLLGAIPPELQTVTQFRRQRLEVLEQAGLAAEKLDQEWSSLLHDFPEDVSLHLLRYDSLRRAKRSAEAAAVLDGIRPVDPESPYILARLVEVLAGRQEKTPAIDVLLRVFFAETEESTWPATYAWDAVKNAHWEEEAYLNARGLLQKRSQPTLRALSILASYAMRRSQVAKRTVQPPLRAWFPDAGAREVLALLKVVDAASWIEGRYRASLLRQLSDYGYQQLVVNDWKKHKAEVEADAETWSETARALVALKRTSEARKFLAGWRERVGVGMWVVANYVMCFSALRKRDLKEVFLSCRDALAGLPHDHCAKYLVHLEAEACALLGDRDSFLRIWSEHRDYLDGKLENNEWFETKRRHLLDELPAMARFLEQNEERLYRKAVRSLRWKHFFSFPQIYRPTQKKRNFNLR